MSNLPTTITIDGKEYELVPKSPVSSSSEGRGWEIISFKYKHSDTHISFLNLDEKRGCYYWGVNYPNKNPWTLPDILNCKNFNIHSVKRISDSTIWATKDVVSVHGEKGTFVIDGWEMKGGSICALFIPFSGRELTSASISYLIKAPSPSVERPPIGIMPEWIWKEERLKEIDTAMSRYVEYHKNIPEEWLTESAEIREWLFKRKKIKSSLTTVEKEPRFITEDRKNIFEGDRYAYVPKETLAWVNVSDGKSTPQPESSFLYFSTEQAANDYVIMNKPCLSVNDVKSLDADVSARIANTSNNCSRNRAEFYIVETKGLKQLVKDRLNY